MALSPSAPYTISFLPDPVPDPSRIDHTKTDPGPADGKRRAGYTSFTLDAKMTVDRRVLPGPPLSLYFESVLVEFFLKNFNIQVSSDYRVGSCPYRVTCEHEFESHVRRPIRLFTDKRDSIVQRFNALRLPTRQMPERISAGQEDATEARLMRPVIELVRQVKAELKTLLDGDRTVQDDASHYQAIWAKCRPEEWGAR
jgi:hypothetical protein